MASKIWVQIEKDKERKYIIQQIDHNKHCACIVSIGLPCLHPLHIVAGSGIRSVMAFFTLVLNA